MAADCGGPPIQRFQHHGPVRQRFHPGFSGARPACGPVDASFVGVFPAWFRPVVPVGFGMGLQVAPGGAPLESAPRNDFGAGTNASGVWMGWRQSAGPLVRPLGGSPVQSSWNASLVWIQPPSRAQPDRKTGVSSWSCKSCCGVRWCSGPFFSAVGRGQAGFFFSVCAKLRCGRSGEKNISPCVQFCGRFSVGRKKSFREKTVGVRGQT